MAETAYNAPTAGAMTNVRERFDFWKVVGVSSLAVALINLGLLYFLTMSIRTIVLSDVSVINTHPNRPARVLTNPLTTVTPPPPQTTPSLTVTPKGY